MLLWGGFGLLVLVGSGLLLADRLTPPNSGAPSHALPVAADHTALDRELAPLLAEHPGKTGAITLVDGIDAFAARAMSARQAGRSLDLQYYIWHDDLTGRLLAREAWRAADRGVRVRLLLDDINAGGKDTPLLVLDGHPNIEVRLYNPFRNRSGVARLLEMLQRGFSLNHRMHNKAWVADGRVAIVGGRNIGLEYFSASQDANFHDLDLLLFGPEVAEASAIFDAFWNSEAVVPLSHLGKLGMDDIHAVFARTGDEAGGEAARRYLERVESSPTVRAYADRALAPHWSDRIRIVSDPPVKRPGDDSAGWLVARIDASLRGAREGVLLVSPYFVPGAETTALLVDLASRGAHVGVVTNSLAANDVVAVHGGYAKYRRPLLAGGVHLYELRPEAAAADEGGRPRAGRAGSSGASLHTKAFLVDGHRGFIGSYNLDPRSAWLNTEMGVFFDDPGLAADLRAEYLHLAGPALSWKVGLDPDGRLAWLDAAGPEPRLLRSEPDASRWRRLQAWAFRWLPLESQL
ncbi:MAG: phospholipase D family protein [Gammaproteobacteria bacterium]|nr:phospholipase D family protein [Gammaproteobacteria bacterium]